MPRNRTAKTERLDLTITKTTTHLRADGSGYSMSHTFRPSDNGLVAETISRQRTEFPAPRKRKVRLRVC
jgi:hypothetical protein